jgi:hypothetical protein
MWETESHIKKYGSVQSMSRGSTREDPPSEPVQSCPVLRPSKRRPRIAWFIPKGATIVGQAERTKEYVSTHDVKSVMAVASRRVQLLLCARRQGTPAAAFFNIP